MYLSITVPIADFRHIHPQGLGRLDKPRWGAANPEAQFMRGFGAIHRRTNSAGGFIGESYYADFDNLAKYPHQLFLRISDQEPGRVLFYPTYRRFYFDGLCAGRFEFGFRANEGTIYNLERDGVIYDPEIIAAQALRQPLRVTVGDGRVVEDELYRCGNLLRDAYLISSTRSAELCHYPVAETGREFASAGQPYLFIRSSPVTPITENKNRRSIEGAGDRFMLARSRLHKQDFDVAIQVSPRNLDDESASERLSRLFYAQIRAVASAHSFYLKQTRRGAFSGNSNLDSAVKMTIARIRGLEPLEGNDRDAVTCREMSVLLAGADINLDRLADEIGQTFKKSLMSRLRAAVLPWLDQKTDIAVEAAASTATSIALRGGL